MTCVHGFFGNCQIALPETINNHVEYKNIRSKENIYTWEKKPNDKVIANEQPNV